MKRTILVAGYGPGISNAVARRFGREGFAVAIVARSRERLERAAADLQRGGIEAKPFAADLGDPDAVRAMVRDVRASSGPIAVVHWNASTSTAGDFLTATTAELRTALDLSVHGLVAATQEALPDLKAEKGSLLVTAGKLALDDANVNAMAVEWKQMGLALGKATQQKVVGLLHHRLRAEGVYVGEVFVLGLVKGTPWDKGDATLDPDTVAEKFWELHSKRAVATASVGG